MGVSLFGSMLCLIDGKADCFLSEKEKEKNLSVCCVLCVLNRKQGNIYINI